jgi:hypothetical protein
MIFATTCFSEISARDPEQPAKSSESHLRLPMQAILCGFRQRGEWAMNVVFCEEAVPQGRPLLLLGGIVLGCS